MSEQNPKDSPPVEAPNTAPPEERHRDVDFDVQDPGDGVVLVPDFEAEETDEADEVFEDDIEEGVNPEEAVDPNPNEETS